MRFRLKDGAGPLPAVLLATFVSGFGFGVVVPVSSVALEELKVPTPLIGLVATALFAGFAAGGPLACRCIRLYGIRSTVAGGLFISGIMLMLTGLGVWLPLWFALRFVLGAAAAVTDSSSANDRVSRMDCMGVNLEGSGRRLNASRPRRCRGRRGRS